MFNKRRITDPYEPNKELRELLEDVRNNSSADFIHQKKVSLIQNIPGHELQHIVEYKNKTITMNGTASPLGIFITLQGDRRMVSALILTLSLGFGKPTLTYQNSIGHHEDGPDLNDVTAEWYGEEFVEKGVPELRLKNREEISETQKIPIETLEQRAKHWLSSK